MKYILMVFLLMMFWSCTSCNSNSSKSDSDSVTDKDLDNKIDTEPSDKDNDIDTDQSDEQPDELIDGDTENPDIDMYCPLPMDAKYPYHRRDGTIHFCRPCDTPDEYDPQCVKSLWKDLNKEVYDSYKKGEFEDNEYVVECNPWPCEWNVTPTPNELESTSVQKCDIFLNPRTWANSFSGFRRESNMDGGKILFQTDNYRIGDKKPIISDPGYAGQRAVLYDIKAGKYEVIGKSISPYYMSGHILINPYITVNKKGFKPIVDVVPYKSSYKYDVIFTDEDTNVSMDVYPYVTDKWTIMVINHLDNETDPVGQGNRSLVYAKTGEWKWTTLAYGNPDGKAGELSISGDNAMFAHIATNESYICNLSKGPKSLKDCKRVGRSGEIAGFPKFDRDNPNRIVYRSMGDGKPANHFVAMNISKDPWTLEKEFDITPTESSYISMWLMEVRSNVILYEENYVMNESGYQEDGKLCYYRIDKGKTYCSRPIEGQTSYGHGYASFENKYLFWQPMYKAGYILRDMDCYCKEEGICPFEE